MEPEFETGRYRMQERLAPESEAWLAEDLEDPPQQVVIKILPAGSDAIAARHLIASLAKIERPELNTPRDEGELPDGRPFLVFPFVEGSTLRELLNAGGPLPLATVGSLSRQIAAGIGALHSLQMVYGVLAPEHVIVQQGHGTAKAVLLNPGIYRVRTETSTSPGYLPHEQISGQPQISSDIFSLGVLTAEMLTGRRAFRYGSLTELRRQQRIGIARGSLRKLRSKIPMRVEEEIRRATAWDAAHRPSDIELWGARMAEYLGATNGFPKRRLFLGGVLGVALAAAGLRRCRRR